MAGGIFCCGGLAARRQGKAQSQAKSRQSMTQHQNPRMITCQDDERPGPFQTCPAYKSVRTVSPGRALKYVRVRELEEGNPTKVRPGPIPRRPRCQFDTSGPWFDGVKPDRLDTEPVRHTSPDVCGRSSAPARRHRSAACLVKCSSAMPKRCASDRAPSCPSSPVTGPVEGGGDPGPAIGAASDHHRIGARLCQRCAGGCGIDDVAIDDHRNAAPPSSPPPPRASRPCRHRIAGGCGHAR